MASHVEDNDRLKQTLQKAIEIIQDTILNIKQQRTSTTDTVTENSALNNSINTLSINDADDKLMKILTIEIQTIFNNCLAEVPGNCRDYIFDLLSVYDYDCEKLEFTETLTANSLDAFLNQLEGTRDSLNAYKAAEDGDTLIVKTFVDKYPQFKDKPGLRATTLLYSAARNDHLELVKYLIKEAGSSVNAQNQQHFERALGMETIRASDYQVDPVAGSTALHVACYRGHLSIVKYLIEHGADYYIRNQAEETPIDNIESHTHIREYFQQIINTGYTTGEDVLPVIPIIEGRKRSRKDCIWEYKPFFENYWQCFESDASAELNQALTIGPNQEFKRDIYLNISSIVYTVSLVQFLRHGGKLEEKEELAWIRCRGSSISNFDCYALWQISLIKYPQSNDTRVPCLEVSDFPTMDDPSFQVQLNTWYNCNAQINSLLDKGMNNRRRSITMVINYISDDELHVDMKTFSVTNKDRTILGSIRWIPKLVVKGEDDKNKLISIDNFQALANVEITLLTTQRLKMSQATTDSSVDQDEIYINHGGDDDLIDSVDQDGTPLIGGEEADSINKEQASGIKQVPLGSIPNHEEVFRSIIKEVSDNETNLSPDDYFKDGTLDDATTEQLSPIEIRTSSVESEITENKDNLENSIRQEQNKISDEDLLYIEREQFYEMELMTAKSEIDALQIEREEKNQQWLKIKRELQQKYEDDKQIQEQKLSEATERLTKLNDELKKIQEQEQRLNRMHMSIKTCQYINIDKQLMHDFLIPEFDEFIRYIKTSVQDIDEYFHDRIPRITFVQTEDTFIITVIGFENHHLAFKDALKRLINLSKSKKSTEEYYQRCLNRSKKSLVQILWQVESNTNIWKQYVTILLQLLTDKLTEYARRFNDHIKQISRSLIKPSILGQSTSPWNEFHTVTNEFSETNLFTNEIETLRNKAFEEFIEQNIAFQRTKFEKTPSKKSIDVVREFLNKIKSLLYSNKIQQKCQVENFKMIPQFLQQIMIYYSCFKIQLPLFESAIELLDKIHHHTITTITTSTGSGKSTLLPALLAADGYDKIIVTQPRRLPCKMISKRVNDTIETDIGSTSYQLSGWAVSGEEHNRTGKILYLTDGLLKEQLLYDEHFITADIQANKWLVFFIDEVHERSVNIDLCLALLARLLTTKPMLKDKIKLIISSATLDGSVPRLFRQIPNVDFTEFNLRQITFPYPVKEIARRKENVLDLVQELYKKRQRNDQILCFVNSVTEVNQCCRLLAELSHGAIIAYPLIQSQSSKTQEFYIEHGSVFFSTTVAETSLTFPSLKYVVDTGMVNIPIYDPESKRTVLEQVRAAESTLKQRRGRLGRTRPGEYYYLYTFKVDEKPFPEPHIRLSDLTNIEFSLRRSPIKNGLQYMQQFLPDKIEPKAIQATIAELHHLGILEPAPSNQFTRKGELLAKLPDFGSLAMAKAVLAGLRRYHCGRDLICLASILSVLNTTAVLKDIATSMKSPDGDFMTLLNIMNTILLVKESVPNHQFNLQRVCQEKGLTSIAHIAGQAMRRYENLENSLNRSDDYRHQAQIRSGKWEFIAKALLAGYADNVFVSMKELHEKTHRFARYNDTSDIAILDLQSTLTRPISQAPVSVVLARDIRYATAVRSTAILSFVGEIKPSWIGYDIERNIEISQEEQTHLNSKSIWSRLKSKLSRRINALQNKPIVSLSGTTGTVINDEFHLRQQMVTTLKFDLKNTCKSNTSSYDNLAKNLESITKMTYIFNPMKWRWQAQKQVKITVTDNPANKTCDVTVEGRDSENQNVKKEFDSFLGWLQKAAVIRHPNESVLPRRIHPKIRKLYPNIEKRITRITDSERTMVDLYNGVKGKDVTRETRMEVVAWIAVCKFHCKLEGGFVRDWVVGEYQSCPAGMKNNPSNWIQYITNYNGEVIPHMHEEIVPADLDCHLSVYDYFDIEKFLDELHKFNIVCRVFREDWRYILLIDEHEPTGPFTMDLIEPHVALTHDRIDFDVSNLSLEKDYSHEIGMRINITESPYLIELESIVENIMKKRYQILRPIDKYVNQRIQKMTRRQWTQYGEPMDYIPRPQPKRYAMLVPLPSTSTLYQAVAQTMKKIGSIQILSIDEVKNPLLEDTYEAMKKVIAKQCKSQGYNPNEQKLFHGTHGSGISGILEDGFDDRFFNPNGAWGHGAYFADDPRKSHNYAPGGVNQERVMFYNKVTLGIISTQTTTNNALTSAPQGCHSVKGTGFQYTEYIVYRYGQALPYLKITYKG